MKLKQLLININKSKDNEGNASGRGFGLISAIIAGIAGIAAGSASG